MRSTLIRLSALLLALGLTASANNVNKRIKFAPGATQATVTGEWHEDRNAQGETFDRYILGASKGQSVTVSLKASDEATVYAWQGDYNNGELGSSSGKSGSSTFKLPKNGDFFVDVGQSERNKSFTYSLTVSIR